MCKDILYARRGLAGLVRDTTANSPDSVPTIAILQLVGQHNVEHCNDTKFVIGYVIT